MINSVFEKSSKNVNQCPDNKLLEFALVGRSNVGKSSLINSLLNNKSIAKTSSKPGKTILIKKTINLIDFSYFPFPVRKITEGV